MIVEGEKSFLAEAPNKMVTWLNEANIIDCAPFPKNLSCSLLNTQLKLLLFIEMHTAVVTSTNAFAMKWTNRIKRCANLMNLAIGLRIRN